VTLPELENSDMAAPLPLIPSLIQQSQQLCQEGRELRKTSEDLRAELQALCAASRQLKHDAALFRKQILGKER
jgi:hypothetical protein